jgi:hypothetical protein
MMMMKSLIQHALGEDWNKLPPALQEHYKFGTTVDSGHMDIEYPRFMQPFLSVLRIFGALVNRSGSSVPTVAAKRVVGERQYWRRTISYPDGKLIHFNSYCVSNGANHIIEFVNPFLGLEMAPYVEGDNLCYQGVRYVVKLGSYQFGIPEWLALGHTTIREVALDEKHFSMDFRLTHPLLGQIFRYAGTFEADAGGGSVEERGH